MSDHAPSGADVFLLISGSTDDVQLLTDQAHLREVLAQIPPLIEMNTIREPLVLVASNNPGLEGYVPIDMSNITISTYTDDPRAVVCIHSCKDMKVDAVLRFIRESFACKSVRSLIVKEAQLR
jgi:S-adenosylmethionine/arginine decarboxylase-like enzyme